MSPPPKQADLFPFQDTSPPTGTVAINTRCAFRTKEGQRIVLVLGIPIAHFAVGDRMAEAYAMVTLVDQGWADQIEIARAFSYSTVSVRRIQVDHFSKADVLFADQFRDAAQAQGVSEAMSDAFVVESLPRTSSMYCSGSTPACLHERISE